MRFTPSTFIRVSSIALSGKHFGNLTKVHGMYRFSLASSEQKTFPRGISGWLSNDIAKVIRNWATSWPSWFFVSYLVMAYYIIKFCEREYHHSNRKNPEDYISGKLE